MWCGVVARWLGGQARVRNRVQGVTVTTDNNETSPPPYQPTSGLSRNCCDPNPVDGRTGRTGSYELLFYFFHVHMSVHLPCVWWSTTDDLSIDGSFVRSFFRRLVGGCSSNRAGGAHSLTRQPKQPKRLHRSLFATSPKKQHIHTYIANT